MNNVKTVTIKLSEQDLADFLEDDDRLMKAYCAELKRRLQIAFLQADVEVYYEATRLIDDFGFEFHELYDFGVDDVSDAYFEVETAMDAMVNDWSWADEASI